MTVGDENAVFRSKVLNQLAWMDARFQKLVRIVQAWGRQQGIVGRRKGQLTPYCVTQMVPPLLPPFLLLILPNFPPLRLVCNAPPLKSAHESHTGGFISSSCHVILLL